MKTFKWTRFYFLFWITLAALNSCSSDKTDKTQIDGQYLDVDSLPVYHSLQIKEIENGNLEDHKYVYFKNGVIWDTLKNPDQFRDSMILNFSNSLYNLGNKELLAYSQSDINSFYGLLAADIYRTPIENPILERNRDDNLDLVPNLKSVHGDSTIYIRGLWSVLNSAVDSLVLSGNGWSKNNFGFVLTPYIIDNRNGEKLREKFQLSSNSKPTYQEVIDSCKIEYGADCSNQQIVEFYYEKRLTIMLQVTYNDTLIKTKKHSIPGDIAKINTIYNVGRLCPPKCPPEDTNGKAIEI